MSPLMVSVPDAAVPLACTRSGVRSRLKCEPVSEAVLVVKHPTAGAHEATRLCFTRGSCPPRRSEHSVDAFEVRLRIGHELTVGRMVHRLDADDFRTERVIVLFNVADELELRSRWPHHENLVAGFD